jgi:imidazolonepropionase-like amidohydrolase
LRTTLGRVAVALLLGAALANCATPTPAPAPTLALVNGTLIDGTGAPPIPDAALVIANGHIVAVGPRAAVTIPPEAQTIDVAGGTILPGFINAHVHQAFRVQYLAAWADAGVTTVLSLGDFTGSPDDWGQWARPLTEGGVLPTPQNFIRRDTVLDRPDYARVVAAGPIVTVEGGYPSAVLPDLVLAVSSPEDARRRVEALLEAGADVVKISLETGPLLSPEEVQAIVAVAHERGTIVLAHVTRAEYVAMALEAGVDAAAHMAVDPLPADLIDRMVSDHMAVIPTLAVAEALGDLGSGVGNLRRFVQAGGTVALGDDYSNIGIELGMPMRDMELMLEAGMTPMQIIQAGTSRGAQVCNLDGVVGALEQGRIGDVLVVEGDPLQDIHALADVLYVIKDGVLIRSPEPSGPGLSR